jgi:hypothetical protein
LAPGTWSAISGACIPTPIRSEVAAATPEDKARTAGSADSETSRVAELRSRNLDEGPLHLLAANMSTISFALKNKRLTYTTLSTACADFLQKMVLRSNVNFQISDCQNMNFQISNNQNVNFQISDCQK